MPERLPLSVARSRCKFLPIISSTDQDGKRESVSIASKKPESERKLRELHEDAEEGGDIRPPLPRLRTPARECRGFYRKLLQPMPFVFGSGLPSTGRVRK